MRFQGTPPNSPCTLLASFTLDGATWELYERHFPDKPQNEDWQSLKLICLQRGAKANFWLGWGLRTERWARVKDRELLERYHPAMLAIVTAYLTGTDAELLGGRAINKMC